MYEKLRMLVKPIEFVVMISLPIIAFLMGAMTFIWAAIFIGAYVVLQLTGWGVKTTQEVIDEAKESREKSEK